jgi:hypothetical protein
MAGADHKLAAVVIPMPVLPMFKLLAWNSMEITYLRTLTAQLRHKTLAKPVSAFPVQPVAYLSVLPERCSRMAAECWVTKS